METPAVDSLNVMCGFDDNYARPFAAMVTSLREFTGANCRLDFILVEEYLTAPIRKLLEQLLSRLPRTTLRWLKFDKARIANAPLALNTHFTSAAYERILAFEQINDCGRLIYLDCDLICLSDVRALWAEPLEGKVIGAVLDPNATFCADGHTEALGLPSGAIHFNSGVLLVDVDEWKRQDVTLKCLRFIDDHRGAVRWVDQDVLNAVVNNWQRLPSYWNVQTHYYKPRLVRHLQKAFPEDLAAVQMPQIVHFNDARKPWQQRYQHPLQNAYHHFLSRSGWNELSQANL